MLRTAVPIMQATVSTKRVATGPQLSILALTVVITEEVALKVLLLSGVIACSSSTPRW